MLFRGIANDGVVWILNQGIAFDYFSNAEGDGKRVIFTWENACTPKVKAMDQQPGFINYFHGNNIVTGSKLYKEVMLTNLYPGIDVKYYFDNGLLRFDLLVHPSGTLDDVKLLLPALLPSRLTERKEVEIDLGDGMVWMSSPVSYFQKSMTKIDVSYRLDNNALGFVMPKKEKYNNDVFVIDPLIYSTYLGGSLLEYGKAVAVDVQGNAYLTGYTKSTNFDVVSGSYQTTLQGNFDVFVSKIDPNTNTLVYSTYIGGTGNDYGMDIAINSSGEVFVVGYTASTDYPTTSGAIQPSHGGVLDVCLSALNAQGTGLLFSTFLGGSDEDIATGIALDLDGNIYLTGYTLSNNFDVTSGAFQTTRGGNYDAFLTKLNTNATDLVFSTYLGGSAADYAYDVAVNSAKSACVVGGTFSTNFDVTPSYQQSLAGGEDAFVTKFSSNGNNLVFSTYLGGTNDDVAFAVVYDDADYLYVTGHTNSTNFDVTTDAYQATLAGNYDAFITKFFTNGSSLVYSTYFGGSDIDYAYGIDLDSLGYVNIIGETLSGDLPVTSGAHQASKDNGFDIFLVRGQVGGVFPFYVTYLGGNSDDYGRSIRCGQQSSIYLTGNTISTNYDVVSPNIQPINQGQTDVIFTKMTLCPSIHPNPSINTPVCEGDTLFLMANEEEGFNYTWFGPGFFVVSGANSYVFPVDTMMSGMYYLRVEDTLNICSYTYSINVDVIKLPRVSILLSQDTICAGSDVHFSVSDANYQSYYWVGPNGFESYVPEPILTNASEQATGMYYLYVTDTYGCEGVDSVYLTVVDCSSLDEIGGILWIIYPNPSADGRVEIWSMQEISMMVYTTDGKKVLEIVLRPGKNEFSLPKGVYTLMSSDQQKIAKLVVF